MKPEQKKKKIIELVGKRYWEIYNKGDRSWDRLSEVSKDILMQDAEIYLDAAGYFDLCDEINSLPSNLNGDICPKCLDIVTDKLPQTLYDQA